MLLVLPVVLAAAGVDMVWCLAVLALAPWVTVVGYETVGHRHNAEVLALAARSSRRLIDLDTTSATPPYEQIRSQLAAHVDTGALQPGDRLPTVRRLAEDLGVATNTVARAYRELEQAGVIETRGRGGSFVTGDQVTRKAKEAAVAYLAETKALGPERG